MAETQTDEQSSGDTGNGVLAHIMVLLSQLGERVGVIEKARPIFESYGSRLDVVERDLSAIRGDVAHIDSEITTHNTIVLGRLDELEVGRADNRKAIEGAVLSMDRMTTTVDLLSTTFKGSAEHRRESNQKNVQAAEKAVEASSLALQAVEQLKGKVDALEQRDAERLRVEREADERSEKRHVEMLKEMRTMRSSFAPVLTLFPGVTLLLLQGGFHAKQPTVIEAVAVTVLLVGWRFAPAAWRWSRLRLG